MKVFGVWPDIDNGRRAARPARCLLMPYRTLVIHALQPELQCLCAYVPMCGYVWKPRYTLPPMGSLVQ